MFLNTQSVGRSSAVYQRLSSDIATALLQVFERLLLEAGIAQPANIEMTRRIANCLNGIAR